MVMTLHSLYVALVASKQEAINEAFQEKLS